MVRNLAGGGDSGSFETDNDNFTFTIQTEDVMTIKADSLTLNMFDETGMLKIDNNNVSIVDVDLEALEIQVNNNTSNIATNSNNILTNTNNIQSNSNNIYINQLDILSNKSRLTTIEDPAFVLPLTLNKINNSVGIGITNPDVSLAVLGTIRSSGNIICGSTLQTNNITATGTATIDGNIICGNNITASSFIGSGASLTNLNGTNITTGTVAGARIANLNTSKLTAGTLPLVRGGTGTTTGTGTGRVVLNNNPTFSGSITVNNNISAGGTISSLGTITGEGNIICNGNLGVNITPTNRLHVSGNALITGDVSADTLTTTGNGTIGGNLELGTNCYIGNYLSGNFACFRNRDPALTPVNDFCLMQDSTGRTLLNSSEGQVMQFRHGNNNNRMTIVPNGDIGIGTTSPTEKLHVNGNVLSTAFSRQFDTRELKPSDIEGNSLKFGFGSYDNDNSTPWADVLHLNSWDNSSGGGTNAIMFNKSNFGIRQYRGTFESDTNYSSYSDCVMADSSGNVGIDGNLTVNGQVNGASDLMRNPPNVSGVINKTNILAGTNTDRFIRFRNGGGSPNGNAGIQFSHFDNPNFYMLANFQGLKWFHSSTNTGTKNDYGTDIMTLSPAGNLGIGTNNPTEKLHVIGDIKATGQIVSGNGLKKITREGTFSSFTVSGPLITINLSHPAEITIFNKIFNVSCFFLDGTTWKMVNFSGLSDLKFNNSTLFVIGTIPDLDMRNKSYRITYEYE